MSASDHDSRYGQGLSPDQTAEWIKERAVELGFDACRITDTDLGEHETHLLNWLNKGFHGSMEYMQRHGVTRSRPADLVPGTIRIISVRLTYYPASAEHADDVLANPLMAYVSRYALGRDYHKLIRQRLQRLATDLTEVIGPFGYRAFTDSAPVLEKAIAQKAGLGWIGKHSNLLNERSGSWFFLGELFTDLPLPVDPPQVSEHCGSCTACIDACPTKAIIGPQQVDARRCISYLTIENNGPIPVEFRAAMGNRIYGCDDCQLVCPFNKFGSATNENDFEPRHQLDRTPLTELFEWTEAMFNDRFTGSAIRRIGYRNWRRNIAVALGNADTTTEVMRVLNDHANDEDQLVREHIAWAISQHRL